MADKPRKPGRSTGQKAAFDRGARPGERPRQADGRKAGNPERGPARPRKVGGIDLSVLEQLEREGLLSEEGRRLRSQAMAQLGGGRAPRKPSAGPGGPGGGFASVDEQLARTLARGPRRAEVSPFSPLVRRPRPKVEEGGERPRRAPGRGAAGAGFADRDRPLRPPVSKSVPQPVPKPVLRGRKLNAAEAEVAERLQKVMARAGVASRRHSEELIQAGRVTVNGRVVTELGTKVVAGKDIIEVDGRPLGKPESLVYVLLNKPKGYVTTLYDPEGRDKVTDLLGDEIGQRIYPVGRLDYDTEGLLLLTNDGELANALMHPAKQVKKTYIAKVRGVPGPAKLRALEKGIELDDGPTAPADVKVLEVKAPNSAVVSIRIHEGRNRQVRRMFEAVGHEVIHLRRITLGPLHLKDLPVGQWRELTEQEVRELYNAAGLRFGGKFAPKAKR